MLLIAVLVVWGVIGYKFISGLNPSLPKTIEKDFNVSFTPKTKIKMDTFSIKNLERDPFLGKLYSAKKNVPLAKMKPRKVVTQNQPRITYGGAIKKQSSSDRVFVININENQYLLKQGQSVDSVKLIKGNAKEVIVRYNNMSQTIKRH